MTKTVVFFLATSHLMRGGAATELSLMLGTQHHMHNDSASSFLEERESLLGSMYLAPDRRVEELWKGQQFCCAPERSSTLLLQRHH